MSLTSVLNIFFQYLSEKKSDFFLCNRIKTHFVSQCCAANQTTYILFSHVSSKEIKQICTWKVFTWVNWIPLFAL